MGLVFGALWGVMQFWDEFSLSHLCAAAASGAVFAMLLGVGASWIARQAAFCMTAASGAAAGVVWWAIAKPKFSVLWSIVVGACFGSLLWLSEERLRRRVEP
jgi:hypothetical protein